MRGDGAEARRQVARLDDRGFADDHGALQRVAQLAHVSRPGVVLEQLHDRFAGGADGARMLAVHVLDQDFHQGRNVFLVLAQGWHVDAENVQPVVKIVAQLPFGDRLFGNLIGCGHHPHVDRSFDLAAEPAQPVVFEDPQQLGLGGDRHLADFIQQQRAALGQLEAAGAALQSAGERAFLVAKNFAFHQRVRNRGAVDGNERLGGARAEFVNGSRQQFLAGAAFTGNQNRGGAGSHQLGQPEDLLHGFGRAHQRTQRALVPELPLGHLQFAPDFALPRRILQDGAQPRRIHRLFNEIVGAKLHRRDRRIDAPLRRQQDYRNLARLERDLLQQFHAVHARHAQVRHHDSGIPFQHLFESLDAVARNFRAVSPGGDQLSQPGPFVFLVLDDQNLFGIHRLLLPLSGSDSPQPKSVSDGAPRSPAFG